MTAHALLIVLNALGIGAITVVAAAILTRALRSASADLREAVWTNAIAAQSLAFAVAASGLVPTMFRIRLPAIADAALSTPRTLSPAMTDVAFTGSNAVVANVVLLVWAIGAIAALARAARGHMELEEARRAGREVTSGPVRQSLERVAAELGFPVAPPIIASARFATPVAWGTKRAGGILVPEDFAAWPDDLRDATVAHELAHIARADSAKRLLAKIACALAWPSPFAHASARAARRESERACDDVALRLGATPSRYAMHLVSVASGMSPSTTPETEPALVGGDELESRAMSILARKQRRQSTRRARLTGSGVVWAVTLLASTGRLAPSGVGIVRPLCVHGAGLVLNVVSRASAGTQVWQGLWDGNECNVSWRGQGALRLSHDRSAIVALGPGGRFRVNEEYGTRHRAVEIWQDSAQLMVRWTRDGGVRPYGADGVAWLRDFLVEASAGLPIDSAGAIGGGSRVGVEIHRARP